MNFIRNRLPWIVGLAALLFYLATLQRWISISAAPIMARGMGLDWVTPSSDPLPYLLSLPIQWFPVSWQPLALNTLSAVFASLTLALLARSVLLLPHNRTRDQRSRVRDENSLLNLHLAYIAPLGAVFACGLQRSFWEHATNYTGEMVGLFLFAYIIRCILEYRIEEDPKWLSRIFFTAGLAFANRWGMVFGFGLILLSMVWIKGFSFFRWKFLAKIFFWWGLGLLLYLALPMIAALKGQVYEGFWEVMGRQLSLQRDMLLNFPKNRILLMSLTSFLPLFMIGIRWPSSMGDTSAFGSILMTYALRFLHGIFLGIAIWVCFDPKFSPRALGSGLVCLPFYYVGAIIIGYGIAYFLLLFTQKAKVPHRTSSRDSFLETVWPKMAGPAMALVTIAIPVVLLLLNFKLVWSNNQSLHRVYYTQLLQGIPNETSVILTDRLPEFYLVKALLKELRPETTSYVIQSAYLGYYTFYDHMHEVYGDPFPDKSVTRQVPEPIDQGLIKDFVTGLAARFPSFYLHPTFGYFLETILLNPSSGLYSMRVYRDDETLKPPLTEEQIQSTTAFWNTLSPTLDSVIQSASRERLESTPSDLQLFGEWLSRGLNHWGVLLQRNGKIAEAKSAFTQAKNLYPDNASVAINLEFNENLASGTPLPLNLTDRLKSLIQKYRTLDAMLTRDGPIDEPDFVVELGLQFNRGRNYRQALQEIHRAIELNPNDPKLHLYLVEMNLNWRRPEYSLAEIEKLRTSASAKNFTQDEKLELIRLESMAHYQANRLDKALELIQSALVDQPKSEALLSLLFMFHFDSKQFDQALPIADQILALNPQSVSILINRGVILLNQQHYSEAVASLTKALDIQKDNLPARINRAIAYLHNKDFDLAQNDYQALEKKMPDSHMVQFGLGEIAFQKQDKDKAIKHYRKYLDLAPANTKEILKVNERLTSLGAKP